MMLKFCWACFDETVAERDGAWAWATILKCIQGSKWRDMYLLLLIIKKVFYGAEVSLEATSLSLRIEAWSEYFSPFPESQTLPIGLLWHDFYWEWLLACSDSTIQSANSDMI